MIEKISELKGVVINGANVLRNESGITIGEKLNEVIDHINALEQEKATATEPCFGEWVLISEKQPTKTGRFLLALGDEVVFAFYKAEIKEIELPSGLTLSVDEAQRCPISINWMPLPEPPKKEGAENV